MIPTPITKDSAWREIASMKTVILRAIRQVFTLAPGLTLVNIILVVVQGLFPLAALLVMKMIVDTVTTGIGSSDTSAVISQLILLLGAAAGIALLIAVFWAVASYTTEVQSIVLTDFITGQPVKDTEKERVRQEIDHGFLAIGDTYEAFRKKYSEPGVPV